MSPVTAKKYYNLKEIDIPDEEKPKNYSSKISKINGYRNMVYKMLKDGINPVIIKEYVKYKGFSGTDSSIENLIKRILLNNFKKKLHRNSFLEKVQIPGLIIIKRNDLLKYITTKNPKTKKDKNIDKYTYLIKDKYPIINEIINVYDDFYNIFKEKNINFLDNFIIKYETTAPNTQDDENIENLKSGIQGFIKSIKKDITPIKAAISFNESSGFVEGNNNKFKLIKRILYGRCNLVNLFKKCFSIFSLNPSNNIFELLNFYSSIPNKA